jgi:hypothetical protein
MGSGAVIYVPSFIKIGSGVQMLIRGDIQTQTNTHTRTATQEPLQSTDLPTELPEEVQI